MSVLRPETPEQALEALRWALSEDAPLELLGKGSKRDLGRPVQAANTLDLSALTGITLYEPEELVLTARAGTPLAEIQSMLDEKHQQLAFEPADYGRLLSGASGTQSIGGVVACNLAGPRRIKAGAARDHLLGFKAVTGRGEAVKSGGRVVKNVTGYDLSKLMAGSYGTLAAMTEVTVKVLPAPEKQRTVLLYGLDDKSALIAMTRALGSEHEVSSAAHLPAKAAAKSSVELVAGAAGPVTALRVEGVGPSVEHRCAALRRSLGKLAETEELHSHNSALFWQEVRDVMPLSAGQGISLWRVSLPPQAAPHLIDALAGSKNFEHLIDWGGGLVWLATSEGAAQFAGRLRTALTTSGGHATLVRADAEVRRSVEVFQPQPQALAALTQRIKESFDPQRILNPGRMYSGV